MARVYHDKTAMTTRTRLMYNRQRESQMADGRWQIAESLTTAHCPLTTAH